MANFEGDSAGTSTASFGEDDHVSIDIESLTPSFENMMSQNSPTSSDCCIFRVPHILRRHNKEAYVPHGFSIGPWHHNDPNLKATKDIKVRYLKDLLPQPPSGNATLKKLMRAIRETEKEARDCYAGPIDVGVADFVQILVLDGCFLIELFRKSYDDGLVKADDPIFHVPCMLQYLRHDLILIENQIPWSVLQRLFEMTVVPGGKTLAYLALDFFQGLCLYNLPQEVSPNLGKRHLLDLLRNWLIQEKGGDITDQWISLPSAKNLADAGIKFRKRESSFASILDIQFRDGILEIPPLLIDEITEVIIRNLISYEQCSPRCSPTITSYAVFLDNLINTAEDLDKLIKNEIIESWLNPGDVIQFFNKLYHDAYVEEYHYTNVCNNVNEYYRRRWPKWRAVLMRNYLGTPWAIASLFVAATFLILTIVQTIFSIIKKPYSPSLKSDWKLKKLLAC